MEALWIYICKWRPNGFNEMYFEVKKHIYTHINKMNRAEMFLVLFLMINVPNWFLLRYE